MNVRMKSIGAGFLAMLNILVPPKEAEIFVVTPAGIALKISHFPDVLRSLMPVAEVGLEQ